MKSKSTGRSAAKIKAELEALDRLPDSEVDFSDIPLQNLNDPKWRNAVRGRFYKPVKQAVALRLDADVLAWLRSDGPGYQSRINEILRREMLRALRPRA